MQNTALQRQKNINSLECGTEKNVRIFETQWLALSGHITRAGLTQRQTRHVPRARLAGWGPDRGTKKNVQMSHLQFISIFIY